MAFSLPRLQGGNPVVDDRGRPTAYFLSYVNDIAGRIEAQEASQQQLIADVASAVAEVAALAEQTATLASQLSGFITFYEPYILENRTRIEAIEDYVGMP